MPPKFGKIFFGQLCKIWAFSGQNHVKLWNFVILFEAIIIKLGYFAIFSGKNHVNYSGILLIFHTYFSGKMSCPPKVD